MRQSKGTRIDTVIDAYTKKGYFSGAVLVAKDGKKVISKGYGFSDYENSISIMPDTRFCIASITKLFTALSIMILHERELLNVNDFIDKYIDTFPMGHIITIHHLLTHTSGITNFSDAPEVMEIVQATTPIEKIIDMFKDKELDFEPGEKYKYSNSGYVLLAYIIEKVSGLSYSEFLQENVFRKLEMSNTGVAISTADKEINSIGYTLNENGRCRAEYIDMTLTRGWADIYSTVEDLYKWNIGLFEGKLVSYDTLNRMLSCYMECGKTNIGYGFKSMKDKVFHEGWLFGCCSYFTYYREKNVVIIVLSNNDMASINNIIQGIEGVLFRRKYSFPIHFNRGSMDAEKFSDYLGTYKFGDEEAFSVFEEYGCLYVQYREVARMLKFPIYPAQTEMEVCRFYAEGIDFYIDFKRDKKSKVKSAVTYRQTYKGNCKKSK